MIFRTRYMVLLFLLFVGFVSAGPIWEDFKGATPPPKRQDLLPAIDPFTKLDFHLRIFPAYRRQLEHAIVSCNLSYFEGACKDDYQVAEAGEKILYNWLGKLTPEEFQALQIAPGEVPPLLDLPQENPRRVEDREVRQILMDRFLETRDTKYADLLAHMPKPKG